MSGLLFFVFGIIFAESPSNILSPQSREKTEVSTEPELENVEEETRRDGGSAVHRSVYIGLAILLLLPVAWLIYRASNGSPAAAPSATQESAPPSEEAMSQFRKYTSAGLDYYQKKDWTNAEASFREALRYAPKSAIGLNNLGAVHNERGEYDAAMPLFQTALSLDPTLDIARNNLAWAAGQKAKQGK